MPLEQLSDQAFINNLRQQIYEEAIDLLVICIRTNGTLHEGNIALHREEFSRSLHVSQDDTTELTVGDLLLIIQDAIYEEPQLSYLDAQAFGQELSSRGYGWYVMPVMNGKIIDPAWNADLPFD